VPAIIPVTTPLTLIVAWVGELLLHVPPGVASLIEIVDPSQTVVAPVIADGDAFTVTTTVCTQPEPIEYVTVAVPGVTPVTTPLAEPMAAIPPGLIVHVPPGTRSPRVVVVATHT
jgi:hypothetical protein